MAKKENNTNGRIELVSGDFVVAYGDGPHKGEEVVLDVVAAKCVCDRVQLRHGGDAEGWYAHERFYFDLAKEFVSSDIMPYCTATGAAMIYLKVNDLYAEIEKKIGRWSNSQSSTGSTRGRSRQSSGSRSTPAKGGRRRSK